jgi:hypothetical protein
MEHFVVSSWNNLARIAGTKAAHIGRTLQDISIQLTGTELEKLSYVGYITHHRSEREAAAIIPLPRNFFGSTSLRSPAISEDYYQWYPTT